MEAALCYRNPMCPGFSKCPGRGLCINAGGTKGFSDFSA